MSYRDTPPFDPFEFALSAGDVKVSGFCCIEFPVSLIPYVTGALEGLKYPAAWKGSESDIARAMQIFETLIAELSTMITACNQPSAPTSFGGCSDMSNGCNPCLPLRIESGILQMYNCGEWVNVGSVGSGSKADINDDVPPPSEWEVEPLEGVEPDFACVKATAAVRLVCDLLDTMQETWNDFKFIANTESAVGYDLKDSYLYLMAAEYLKAQLVNEMTLGLFSAEIDTFTSAENKQKMTCELAPRMDGDTGRFTEEDWQATKRYFWTEADRTVLAEFLVTNAIMAVGKGNIDRAFIANANSNFDCDCPEIVPPYDAIPDGVAHTWSKLIDFRLGDYGFVGHGNGGAVYEEGIGWTYSDTSFDSARLPKIKRVGVGGYDPTKLTYVKIHTVGWPQNGFGGGGGYVFFQYSDQEIAGANYTGQEHITGLWPNPSGKSSSVEMLLNPSDMYWSASQNPGYKTIIDKIVLAGTDDNFWTKLQPDGTFSA